jgi:hypothetical protein
MSNRQLGCGAAYDTDRKKMKERERERKQKLERKETEKNGFSFLCNDKKQSVQQHNRQERACKREKAFSHREIHHFWKKMKRGVSVEMYR